MITLTTPRLTLRQLRPDDLLSLASAVNNRRIARNLLRVPWPYDLDDARAFYDHTRALPRDSAVFAIVLHADPAKVIGVTGYESHGSMTELGYWLAEPLWGRGYMREATEALLAHAFATAGLERLSSRCAIDNEASRRLLIALGFRPTGTDRVFSPVRRMALLVHTFELGAGDWFLLRKPSGRAKRQAP